jgi:mercuric ion transport protein
MRARSRADGVLGRESTLSQAVLQAPKPARLLIFAAAASLAASTCCVLPLLLVMLGASAAWLMPARALEPYWPGFIAAAAVALVFAKRRIAACAARAADSRVACEPSSSRMSSAFWIIAAWTGLVALVPLAAPLFY